MSRNYKFWNQSYPFFISYAVINWIDLFVRRPYCEVLLDSWRFCQAEKGLVIHAWGIMPSHVHLILSSADSDLSGIIRDFKSFTSRQLRKLLSDNGKESRRGWMLRMMKCAGTQNGRNKDFQLWQQHNHPIQLDTLAKLEQRLHYLHMNPVKAGFVDEPEQWVMSSAREYVGGVGLLDVEIID
ncbi:MAG: REP-associated tyrosine transposase [Bacteroidota bacterium]